MRTLHGLIPRNLATRKARTLLTTLGIALGVAAMVATNVMRESTTRSVADLFDQAAGQADLAVTSALANIVGGEGFDAALLERVQEVEGVEAAAPLLQVTSVPVAEMDDWEYSFNFGTFNGAVIYGVDPEASRVLKHYRLAAGEDLASAVGNAILLSRRYAEELGVGLGDVLELVTPTGQAHFTVTGLLASDGLARLNRGQVGVTALETAQQVFERPDRLDQIDVLAASGVNVAALKTRLQAALGEGFRALRPANKGAIVDQLVQTITISMSFVGTVTLVVGGFLVYNTFAMTVAERTRELGLLRALGTGRGQTVGLVLVEAALLGLAGAGIGVFLGLGMAAGMREIVGAAIDSELTALVLLPEHAASALAVGVIVALVASLAPALRAGQLPVVEAIQQRRRGHGQGARWQMVVGLVLAAPSLAGTIVYLIFPIDVSFELASVALIALPVGVGLLIQDVIPPLERLTGAVFGLLGIEGQLGGRNLARSPGRTALTAGALMFGLVAVIVIGAGFNSAKEMGLDYMERTLDAELWIYAPQRLPQGLAAEFEALPEVELARPAASIPTRLIPPDPAQLEVAVIYTAIDPQRSKQLDFYLAPDGGHPEESIARLAAGGAVMIASPLRQWYGLDVGDTIHLQTLQGPVGFEVAGVTSNVTANGYAVTGVYEDAARYFGTTGADIFAVNLVPGADATAVGQRIVDDWGATHNIKFETEDDFLVRARQLADSYSATSNSATLIGVVVAALGVINTLLMNVLERQREIGMLRSLGMTRFQILRLILSESVAIGILGGILGVGLGAWLARYGVTASGSMTGYDVPFVFPLQSVLACVVIALIVPPLAGLWPAWRGARANVVEAMRNE